MSGRRVIAVAFDLMDTVVVDPYREALEVATGLGIAELRTRRDVSAYPAFECARIDEAAYWRSYVDAGVDVDVAAFHATRRERCCFLPGMAELLDDLAGHVVRVVASNYPRWIDELTDGLLAGRFEEVVASHHLGVRKPEPAFFAGLLDRVGLPPGDVAFVDDRDANVIAARAAGLLARRFGGAGDLRAWLAGLGVPIAA